MIFQDRGDAGRRLAQVLQKFKGQNVQVFALPRGGVPVGAEIAKAFRVPLNILSVRKIGHPDNPEYALGAVTENGITVFNEHERAQIDPAWIEEETGRKQEEAKSRRLLYQSTVYRLPTTDQTTLLVDDGVATGLTMEAAIKELKSRGAQIIVVAVPIIPQGVAEKFRAEGVEVIALEEAKDFLGSVGSYYKNFPQISDKEVIKVLNYN